ncbi:MAG: XrtA system polysaccharide deacetylase [Alphaproteobacteria bacterium]
MTVDVEDYFQVQAFERLVDRTRWDSFELRVNRNTDAVLDLFAESGVKATFFTLGWVAEKFPALIRRVVAEGHELASHGFSHVRASDQSPDDFRADVRRTKALLEDVGGVAVRGYRAASFSIGARNLWALDVLGDEGYVYSSSIYPVRHDHYGMPEAPRFAFRPRGANGSLELPITTLALFGRNWPCGGGGYFRLLPYWASRWAMRRVNLADAEPCIFYFHPWEIDPDQPRLEGAPMKSRLRHYVNLSRMRAKLGAALTDFAWDRMDRVYLEARQEAA